LQKTKYIETIKCTNKVAHHIAYHEKRIARTIGKSISIQTLINPPSRELLKCRFIYTEDEIISITYDKYEIKKPKRFKLVFDDDIIFDKKTLARDDINRLALTKADADEIIIIKDTLITDTAIANIAIYLDNQWLTPKNPLLYGTTLDRYLDKGVLQKADITVDMLKNSEKIALLNAMVDFLIIDLTKFGII